MKRRQPTKEQMTATMKAIARKRTCPHCLRQNALGAKRPDRYRLWWRQCRYCGTRTWADE